MTPQGTRTAGRRGSGANAKRGRSISAGRIHFARGCEIGPKGPIKGLRPFMGTAGAHIAELIKTMLEKRASGVELAQLERGKRV